MFSATVKSGISDSSWKMHTTPERTASAVPLKRTGLPSSAMVPESGWTTPLMILMSVDFPAPFSPSTA